MIDAGTIPLTKLAEIASSPAIIVFNSVMSAPRVTRYPDSVVRSVVNCVINGANSPMIAADAEIEVAESSRLVTVLAIAVALDAIELAEALIEVTDAPKSELWPANVLKSALSVVSIPANDPNIEYIEELLLAAFVLFVAIVLR